MSHKWNFILMNKSCIYHCTRDCFYGYDVRNFWLLKRMSHVFMISYQNLLMNMTWSCSDDWVTRTYIYLYSYVSIYSYIHMCVSVYICIYIYKYICMQICNICIYTCLFPQKEPYTASLLIAEMIGFVVLQRSLVFGLSLGLCAQKKLYISLFLVRK